MQCAVYSSLGKETRRLFISEKGVRFITRFLAESKTDEIEGRRKDAAVHVNRDGGRCTGPPVGFAGLGEYIAGDSHPVQLQLAVHCFVRCSFCQVVQPTAARINKIHFVFVFLLRITAG